MVNFGVSVYCCIARLPHVPTEVAVPKPCAHLGPCSTGDAQPVIWDCTSRLDVHHLQPSRQPSKSQDRQKTRHSDAALC